MIQAENRHFSMSQIMIFAHFCFRYEFLAFYGTLNDRDYYKSLNLGISNKRYPTACGGEFH